MVRVWVPSPLPESGLSKTGRQRVLIISAIRQIACSRVKESCKPVERESFKTV